MERIDEDRSVAPEAVRDVKRWLVSSVLTRDVATPMKHLYMAYRLQGGRRSAREFGDVIVHRCKGLQVKTFGPVHVVIGVAPRWVKTSLERAIEENP